MPATTPTTLGILQTLQSLILAHTGTTFAALNSADATRYGVARAPSILVLPKISKMAICHSATSCQPAIRSWSSANKRG